MWGQVLSSVVPESCIIHRYYPEHQDVHKGLLYIQGTLNSDVTCSLGFATTVDLNQGEVLDLLELTDYKLEITVY